MCNCPGCNEPLSHKEWNKYHEKDMDYCPNCGWSEEDGDNYRAPIKDETQLRLEGM